jgi:hypothetical protein
VTEQLTRAEALEKSTNFLKDEYERAKNSDRTFGSLLVAFPNGCIPEFDDDGNLFKIAIVPEDPQDICKILEDSKNTKVAYDAVIAWAAAQLMAKRIIPNREVELFLISHLLGESKIPSKPGRPSKKSKNMYQHAALRLAVAELERVGFTKTRGEETDHQNSACDIVAEAMVALRFRPHTYEHIEEILRNGDRVG